MDKIIRLLEDKKMIHNYVKKFVEPYANLVNEDKIEVNRFDDYLVASYSNVLTDPYYENVSFFTVISDSIVIIKYAKKINVKDDNNVSLIDSEETHIGSFRLKDDGVCMSKTVTSNKNTFNGNDVKEYSEKRNYKYVAGNKNLFTNPYCFEEVSKSRSVKK